MESNRQGSLSTLNLTNADTLSISTSASNSGIGFIAIGFGGKNIAGVYLYPKGADAGKDIYTQAGMNILLNGSKSSSPKPDSTILMYNWKLILPAANASTPMLPFESHDKLTSFIVPALPDNATLPFELNTLDSAGYNSSDLVNVFVTQQATTLAPVPQTASHLPVSPQCPTPLLNMTNSEYFKSFQLKLQENNGLWTWSIQREINDLILGTR